MSLEMLLNGLNYKMAANFLLTVTEGFEIETSLALMACHAMYFVSLGMETVS